MTTGKSSPTTEKALPGFASFLLKEHIDAVAEESVRLSHDLQIPLLKHLQMTDAQLLEVSKAGLIELLEGFAQDRSNEMIAQSIEQWKANRLPFVDGTSVVSDDITLIAQLRKQL